MFSKTTCLDSIELLSNRPAVTVRRHAPDIENLLEQMAARVESLIVEQPRYAYLNPIATVISTAPTAKFFRIVYKQQAEWCKRSRTTFGRRPMRSAKNWASPDGKTTKFERFLERAMCFTGILFQNGNIVPPHEWQRVRSEYEATVREISQH